MNATPIHGAPRDGSAPLPGRPAPAGADDPRLQDLAREVSRGLQLSRSTALSLTRLQLAIRSGDRQQALAALDRLHALDAELEHLVESLPGADDAAGPDGEPASGLETAAEPQAAPADATFDAALARHVEEQKLALAFEKLALVSQISGPDVVSPPPPPDFGPPRAARTEADFDAGPPTLGPPSDLPSLSDWPPLPAVRPTVWKAPLVWLLGLVVTLLVTIALGAAAVLMTGG